MNNFPIPRPILLHSPYHWMAGPLLQLLQQLHSEFPSRNVVILSPELIRCRGWEHLLHAHCLRELRRTLLRCGGPRPIIAGILWYLKGPDRAEGLDPKLDNIPVLAAPRCPVNSEPV